MLAVTGGALAQQHWSYQPIVRPQPPIVAEAAWRAPLDAFVRTAMQARGLAPSPAADRATWLRRVTLDLTGLPPTLMDLDAFLDDGADEREAKARVVDRLLTTPAFAERWTQWWLDLARYADSQGYEKDGLRRTMWRYRDWVLDAFARDVPFDQFTIEQLAGDLLPGANDEHRLATAFHRQTMTNTEGGTDDEEFRVAAVVDRVDTTLSVWMGSTLGCAQCHDHKYDPFTQREFFELFAFFDQTEDADRDDDAPVLRVPTLEQRAAAKGIEGRIAATRARLVAAESEVAAWAADVGARHAAFRAAALRPGSWHVLGPVPAGGFEAAHRTAFAPERDGVRLEETQEGQTWRVEPGFIDGAVHTWTGDGAAVYLHRTIEAASATDAVLSLGSDDAIKVWWNGIEVLAKEVARGAALDQEVLAVVLRPGTNTLTLKISNGGGPSGFAAALRVPESGAELERVLAIAPADRTPSDRAVLAAEFVARAPALTAERAEIARLERDFEAQRGPAVPVMRELPVDRRRVTRIHRRGNFLDPGDVVQPGVPAVWPGLPADASRDRLGFARWLMSRENPLTARVLANRIWSELFGAGLVTTLEDFGTQGEAPSHPELLDWLAAEFRDGWSLRHLLRTIVLSATYGQSSAWNERHREVDPDNRWLSRGPSFRLSAEMVRDQALAVSGMLSSKLGGPSVMPAQPDGVWMQIYSGEKWVVAENDDAFRRSLYTFWRRTSPHPAMLVFDAMSRESCVLRRQRSNTPLQALVLWNEPTFVDAAAALSALVVRSGVADADGMLQSVWRRCLGRLPTATELRVLQDLFAAEAERAHSRPRLPRESEAEHAAWYWLAGVATVAGVVLSLDEFVTKR